MEPADDGREPTVAELKAYIEELKRHIQRLEAERDLLFRDVQEYQRRDLLPIPNSQ